MIISDSKAPTRIAIAFAVSALGGDRRHTTRVGGAITIKQWVLKTEGYPRVPEIRVGRIQEDPSRRRRRRRGFSERGLQDHDPGGAGRLRSAGRVLQLVGRGCAPAGARRPCRSTSPISARRRAASKASSRRAGCRPSSSTANITVCRPTPCRSIFITTRRSSRITT